ncbi:helix-turn-helix transcriptional regulator [Shouchella miscanthi]|uniref:helix-turn-helix transcriptional regulator n=1 Tax=Shouchella miscanthi TaxID=2598861 RepID=UPI00119D7062|nr:helix-turn-helix transcriptional regulator [Shouchella miscanthi]
MKSRIGFWIDERGLQTKYIAKKLGVTTEQVTKWKRGEGHPRIQRAFELAALLNVKVDDLYESVDHSGNNESEK